MKEGRSARQARMVLIAARGHSVHVKLWFPLAASPKWLLGLVGGGGPPQLPRVGLLCEKGPEHKDRLVPEEKTLEA